MSFGDENDELDCTLWVGNLDPKITESILFELFMQAGPIEKIHIPKGKDGSGHKGYCFITFRHDQSVPYTMNLMDGTSLYGKVLKLQPRPGSKHKKLMDAAKENEQQRQLIHQQMQVPVPQQIQGQAQWFISPPHPQMAQFQNMLVYPNQMFQAYPPGLPNLNNGMPATVIQLPPGMATQLIPVPVPPQQVQGPPVQPQQTLPQEHHLQQYPRGLRPSGSGDFRQPRPPRGMENGYSMHRHPNGNNAQFPSQYTQSQVLNGSQSQSPRFPQANRGPRPHVQRTHHQSAPPRNSNNVNGNATRSPFSHRSPAPAFQTPPPVYHLNPYQHQSPPPVGGAPLQYQTDRQFYQRPPFPAGSVYNPY